MQSLHSLRRALPPDQRGGYPIPAPNTNTPADRRVSLAPRQPSFTRKDIRKTFLFAQNPDNGPAIESPHNHHSSTTPTTTTSTANPTDPPSKRSDLALDDTLYLPKSDDANFYGRFITLGYHKTSGPMNDPLKTRSERNKTFDLWKRVRPNGWKFKVDQQSGFRATTVLSPSTRERLRTLSLNTPPQERGSTSIRVAALDRSDRLIEYTLVPSTEHDLFQFGRDPYNNDFCIPGHSIEGHTWYFLAPPPTSLWIIQKTNMLL